jgi:hypothetical protein
MVLSSSSISPSGRGSEVPNRVEVVLAAATAAVGDIPMNDVDDGDGLV